MHRRLKAAIAIGKYTSQAKLGRHSRLGRLRGYSSLGKQMYACTCTIGQVTYTRQGIGKYSRLAHR